MLTDWMWSRRKREVKKDAKVFGLRTVRMEVPLPKTRKAREEAG